MTTYFRSTIAVAAAAILRRMYVYKGQTLCTTYPTTTKIALRLCSRLSMNGNDIKVHLEGENRVTLVHSRLLVVLLL